MHSFLLVGGREAKTEQFGFVDAAGVKVGFNADINRRLGDFEGHCAFSGDLGGDRLGFDHQIGQGNDFIDQAQTIRFVSTEHIAGVNHIFRSGFSNQSGQALRPGKARDNPEINFRLAKLGRFRSNTQVAVQAILSGYKVEQQGYKSCMGLLKLADKYTPERLENACKRALEYTPRPSLKNIQAILASGQDKAIPEQSTATASSSRYGFTRGAEYYGRGSK